jgi:hypothetical protein
MFGPPTHSHGILERYRERMSAVGYRIQTPIAHAALGNRLKRMRHGSGRLRFYLSRMTGGAVPDRAVGRQRDGGCLAESPSLATNRHRNQNRGKPCFSCYRNVASELSASLRNRRNSSRSWAASSLRPSLV